MESFRRILFDDAQQIYTRMLEAHVAEITFREQWAQVAGRMQRARDETPPGRFDRWARLLGFARRTAFDIDDSKAAKRGAPAARGELSTRRSASSMRRYRYFDVTGGKTGKRYRIHHGSR